MSLLARELQKVGVNVAAIQEVRWPRSGEREFRAVDPTTNTAWSWFRSDGQADEASDAVETH